MCTPPAEEPTLQLGDQGVTKSAEVIFQCNYVDLETPNIALATSTCESASSLAIQKESHSSYCIGAQSALGH
jgi:hypothetical protein